MKKAKLIIIFLVCITFNLNAEQVVDVSKISKEKIVFESTSPQIDIDKLRRILFIGIDLSLENFLNKDTTSTYTLRVPYQYRYLIVYPDMSYQIKQKEKIKKVYDLDHPDVINSGELYGYVLMPDIDGEQEHDDIKAMLDILKELFQKNTQV